MMTIEEKAFRHVLNGDDEKAVRELRTLEVKELADLLANLYKFHSLVAAVRRKLRDERQADLQTKSL